VPPKTQQNVPVIGAQDSTRNWSQHGNAFIKVETTNVVPRLPQGILTVHFKQSGEPFLVLDRLKFTFPYKVYQTERKFVERVNITFKNTNENLGILLNGIKGTGKSVTAEQICNDLMKEYDMPIILITQNFGGIDHFLSSIDQDIIVFVDEFEKTFANSEDEERWSGGNQSRVLLSLMDGALKSEHRRVFVFTTNKVYIDENLLERPGRIRYKKEFGDLTKEAVEEIVDDMLRHKQHKEAIIAYISTLNIITVDIVKAVVQEVNIHNEEPEDFRDVFNVSTKKSNKWDIYEGSCLDQTNKSYLGLKKLYSGVSISPSAEWENADINDYEQCDIHFGSKYMGIVENIEENVITITPRTEDTTKDKKNEGKKYTIVRAEVFHPSYTF